MDMRGFKSLWTASKEHHLVDQWFFSRAVLTFTFNCNMNSMSPSSRQRILNVMGTFRPAFRHVAQSLTDIDLILVEEAFERLLLVGY
jgi:hypothetical protein